MRPVPSAILAAALLGTVLAACDAGPRVTPPITPGTTTAPRPVVLILKDYEFIPATVDLVPGETVVFQVIDGGLAPHEAVFGPMAVQDAWEAAEGPTVSVAPGLEGLRIFVASGERRDVVWTVPLDLPTGDGAWLIGCHIPGHWQKGMIAAIRLVTPVASTAPGASASRPTLAPAPS
jgi:uncharacterized cupredoxin-like copper-binding protein